MEQIDPSLKRLRMKFRMLTARAQASSAGERPHFELAAKAFESAWEHALRESNHGGPVDHPRLLAAWHELNRAFKRAEQYRRYVSRVLEEEPYRPCA
jgi:hypothetical protein